MELIKADPESDGKTWTFSLPADSGKNIILRQLKKKNFETPGVEYKLKISG